MKKVTITLRPELLKTIEKEAQIEKRKVSEFIRILIIDSQKGVVANDK